MIDDDFKETIIQSLKVKYVPCLLAGSDRAEPHISEGMQRIFNCTCCYILLLFEPPEFFILHLHKDLESCIIDLL